MVIALVIVSGLAALPLFASADEDFFDGETFGSDAGGFFGSDTGSFFGGDTGGFFGSDAGSFFGDSSDDGDVGGIFGADSGFSAGTDAGDVSGSDVGIVLEDDVGGVDLDIDIAGAVFEDFGGFSSFDGSFSFNGGFDAGAVPAFALGGVSGAVAPPEVFSAPSLEAAPVFFAPLETFSGPSFEAVPVFFAPPETFSAPAPEFIASAPPIDSGTTVIAETPFEPPPSAGEPFFAGAEPAPFIFAGSEPLAVVTLAQAIQPAVASRSRITLSQLPYTGIGSVFASVLFILTVLTLSGVAAYFLTATMRRRRQNRIGRPAPVRPVAPKAMRPVFAGW